MAGRKAEIEENKDIDLNVQVYILHLYTGGFVSVILPLESYLHA